MTVIDISSYQGHPDFAAVKAAGVSLVIMKAADGESHLFVDSVYAANRAAARAAGLAVGSYFFNGNAASPTASADYYLSVIDYRPGDVVALDVEGPAGIVWNPGQVLEFVNRVKQVLGIAPLVYMSSSVTRSQDWSAVVATGAPLWVASYGPNNGQPNGAPQIAHWGSWALWQYTSVAPCPGISGNVDTSMSSPSWASSSATLITPEKKKDDDMATIHTDDKNAQWLVGNCSRVYLDGYHSDLWARYMADAHLNSSEYDICVTLLASVNFPPPTVATVDAKSLAADLAPLLQAANPATPIDVNALGTQVALILAKKLAA